MSLDANLTLPVSGANALSSRKVISIDTNAPTAASSVGFAAANTNATSFDLSWANSTDPNFDTHLVKICEVNDCATSCSAVVSASASPQTMSGVNGKTYYGCVQGRDLLGHLTAFVPSIMSIRVDTVAPTVTDVDSSTVSTLFKIGDVIPISVTFSEPIVLGSGSNITLKIANGGSGIVASYAGITGGNTLNFNYTVASGDAHNDLEVFSTASLVLSGGTTLRDAGGNNAVLTLPTLGGGASLSGHKTLVVDGVRPTVPSAVIFSAPAELLNPAREIQWGPSVDLNFDHYNAKFCEATDCSTSCFGSATSLTSPKTLTGTAGKTFYACVQGQDLAGNTSAWVPSATTASIDASPTFTGATAVDVLGSWTGMNAKVKISFGAAPTGHITQYRVYYSTSNTLGSFDLNTPLATITRGDATYDTDPNDDFVYIAKTAASLEDGYILVRYDDQGAYFPDTNASIATLNVLKGSPGYKLVPKSFSGLAYDYYIMKYEASLGAGTHPGGDAVTLNETSLAECAAKFHVNGTANDASCGTRAITKAAVSVAGVVPANQINWHSSYFACRNASSSTAKIRMATYEEWMRASRNIFADHAAASAFNETNSASACNGSSGAARNAGSSTACLSALNINDMVGNMAEWVDYRLTPMAASRFGSTSNEGKLVRNGIDNITMQWPEMRASVTTALTMGSFWNSATTNQFGNTPLGFFDANTTGGTGIGFRCVGFRADAVPTLSELALANQPKYTAADLAAPVASRHVPENNFVGDDKPERVTINVTGAADGTAEGNIDISWTPWDKTVCAVNGSCTSADTGLTYKLYRFVEPNFYALKQSAARWALNITGSTYTADTLLDPIGIDSSWNPLFTSSTTEGKLIATISNCNSATPANCVFNDNVSNGTGFSPNKIYEYVLVVGEGSSNYRVAEVQRQRSYVMIGTFLPAGGVQARIEPRFRKAAVFPIDAPYQESRAVPQVMVHVPMDVSGLDRDFFMHKYEASMASGSINNGGGGAGGLPQNLGVCNDILARTNSMPSVGCGIAGYINVTSAVARSSANRTPMVSLDNGDAYRTCVNANLTDADGKAYRLHLPSGAEWFKAADWGDVDFDGTIDQNNFTLGVTSIADLQATAVADAVTVRCHADNNPSSAYNSGTAATANCMSRYGAENMVGNVAEWIADRISNYTGQDNGIDGHAYSIPFWNMNFTPATGDYSMIHGYPLSNGASPYATFDDYLAPTTNSQKYLLKGGSYDSTYGTPGRFTTDVNQSYAAINAHLGVRCSH